MATTAGNYDTVAPIARHVGGISGNMSWYGGVITTRSRLLRGWGRRDQGGGKISGGSLILVGLK